MRGYNAACVHVIAGDATETGAGNCAVSALPCLETQPPSGLHRAAGDP